jgi:predicted secreted hydrolase
MPALQGIGTNVPQGFAVVDGSRQLSFPGDFGAHEEYRTEWWYYTGNLKTSEDRHFGFQLTIFRLGLVPPAVSLPTDSDWYNHSVYFAHFALSDVSNGRFYSFDRYARPGPSLAGAESEPFHVWIEDWGVMEQTPSVYHLQAAQADVMIDLHLTDEMGIVLHGENGYSRKGQSATNASYYYSQPRLRADGVIQVDGSQYTVSGLAWHDHEFSSSVLDEDQIGWDWFSLQFEDGAALMLFQLRERDGQISSSSSGTFIASDGSSQTLPKNDFKIYVLEEWYSPRTQAAYPGAWTIELHDPSCLLEIYPWMADQELDLSTVTYWEGAVRFGGQCQGIPVSGNGYVELTGYAGNVPLR